MNKFFSLLLLLVLAFQLKAETDKKLVYKINIKQEIGSTSLIHLQNGLHHATKENADYVLLDMNTYGGAVMEADSMRTAILNFHIPVYVFINNNAASAGALISIACDKIFMTLSANIGAATVVDGGTGEKAPDKYQSYMRSLIRSTAESHGRDTIIEQKGDTVYKWKRDPRIAEAMVDERVVVPGIIDSTKVLTLTANEALELGYCDGIAQNVNEVITKHIGLSDYEIKTYNPTTFDNIKGFLMNGAVQAFLIMFIIGGIYFELKTPGFGLPSAVAVTAAILYFTPLYMDGFAQNWEILIFVVGLILIAFEIFVIPGFGFAGIAGIVFAVVGLFLSLIGNIDFNFEGVSLGNVTGAVLTVSGGVIMSAVLIVYLASRIGKDGIFRNVALNTDQEGFISVSEAPRQLIGKIGIAATVLRPSGRVIIDDEYYDAVSNGGFIEKGQAIKVMKYENSQVYVSVIKE
ncbi:nodulation protein NfeD [Dysgonomonas sp. 216]|uniref:NfeD family protein n=1 Tax=Dysgonomonas sp. 216 TaxID=2302934 RepID=UPI0013D1A9BD|nr:nodulation protein NfeD [Dysgonomonas sp. 216]NDW19524.1 nodulation protein NfeD [Dysgonomonas sp. 216]